MLHAPHSKTHIHTCLHDGSCLIPVITEQALSTLMDSCRSMLLSMRESLHLVHLFLKGNPAFVWLFLKYPQFIWVLRLSEQEMLEIVFIGVRGGGQSWAGSVGKVKWTFCRNSILFLSVKLLLDFHLLSLFPLFCFSPSTPCLLTLWCGLNWGRLSHQSCNYMQTSQTPLSWAGLCLDSLHFTCMFTLIKETFVTVHFQLW